VNRLQWSTTDQRWYLGVRCQKCRLPILFAVDHSGTQDQETQPAGKLVLTCTVDSCKFKADYTGAVVMRVQKSPTDIDKNRRIKTSGKGGGSSKR
jgi:hypothetical protein